MKYLLTALLPALAGAAILPDTIGTYQRGKVSKPANSDQAIWTEYGLKSAETAIYQSDAKKFTATVWQLPDTTGSLAAFQWQRPADATPSTAKQAVETPTACFWSMGTTSLPVCGL